jgi:hypothetical protein
MRCSGGIGVGSGVSLGEGPSVAGGGCVEVGNGSVAGELVEVFVVTGID